MNIALITGASSGLGREFAYALKESHPEIEEYWLIARRKERLEQVAEKLDRPCRILAMDLTDPANAEELKRILWEETPKVQWLINNSGCGTLGDFSAMTVEEIRRTVQLNCTAMTVVENIVLPFVPDGGYVINTCSIASFVPNPRMAVYSATKAYVMSLSRALGYELKERNVHVLAVCPAPMDTEFLALAGISKGASPTFDRLPHIDPVKVAKGAIRASERGRSVYTYGFFYKFYRLLAKILPHNWLMPAAKC